MPPTAPPASPAPTDAAGLLKELTDRGLPTANLPQLLAGRVEGYSQLYRHVG